MKYLIKIIIISIIFSACKKDIDEPKFSDIPAIKLLSVSPTQVQALQDSIRFEVEYTDGDGDLGSNDPQAENLFIIDNRINLVQAFRIQNIVPDGSTISIKGTLGITLPNTLITDGSSSQQVQFTIYLIDRAGHESNRVTSQAVRVMK